MGNEAGFLTDATGTPISSTTPLQVTGTSTSSGSTTPSDAFANPTNAVTSFSLNAVWNGTTWDRWVGAKQVGGGAITGTGSVGIVLSTNASSNPWVGANNPGDAANAVGFGAVGPWIYNGTTWDRMREFIISGTTAGATGYLGAGMMVSDNTNMRPVQNVQANGDATALNNSLSVGPWIYNGASWDRMRSASIGNAPGANTGVMASATYLWTGGGNLTGWGNGGASADASNGQNLGGVAKYIWNGTTYDRAREGQLLGSTLTNIQPATAALSETSGTTAAGGQITASVVGVSAKTSYLTGFDITLSTGVAGVVTATVTGITNQLNYAVASPTAGSNVYSIRYPVPIPATATNTSIVVTVPAVGGGTAVNDVNAYGFTN